MPPLALAGLESVAAFSLGIAPHALVSGRPEPGFDREPTRYARAPRRRRVPVRARRPLRGHDPVMWEQELAPALARLLECTA